MRKGFSGILVALYIVPDCCKHEPRHILLPLMGKLEYFDHWLDDLGNQDYVEIKYIIINIIKFILNVFILSLEFKHLKKFK